MMNTQQADKHDQALHLQQNWQHKAASGGCASESQPLTPLTMIFRYTHIDVRHEDPSSFRGYGHY